VLGRAGPRVSAPARRVDIALLGLARRERGLLGGLAPAATVLGEVFLYVLAALAEMVAGRVGDAVEVRDPLVDGAPLGPRQALADLGA